MQEANIFVHIDLVNDKVSIDYDKWRCSGDYARIDYVYTGDGDEATKDALKTKAFKEVCLKTLGYVPEKKGQGEFGW